MLFQFNLIWCQRCYICLDLKNCRISTTDSNQFPFIPNKNVLGICLWLKNSTSGEALFGEAAARPILLTDDVTDDEGEASENFSNPTLRTVAPEIVVQLLCNEPIHEILFAFSLSYLHPSTFLLCSQDHHSCNYNMLDHLLT